MKKNILYKKSVSKDLERIDRGQRVRIMLRIEKDLSAGHESGKRLSGDFEGLLRIRIGDYRVIYTVIPAGILILRIAHRKEIYR